LARFEWSADLLFLRCIFSGAQQCFVRICHFIPQRVRFATRAVKDQALDEAATVDIEIGKPLAAFRRLR
jgi:hypothetical protein